MSLFFNNSFLNQKNFLTKLDSSSNPGVINGSLEKDVVYVCTVKYYSDLEREILPFSK